MSVLNKINLHYGDWKLDNVLLTFSGKQILIGDLGCSFFKNENENTLKGLTIGYVTNEVFNKYMNDETFTEQELNQIDNYAFFKTYINLIDYIDQI